MSDAADGVRLQKLLSQAGVASRRAAEQLIVDGRVEVDGEVVTELGTRVDPAAVAVTVDGEAISWERPRRYLLLNKPAGYVTTVSDTHGRPTVLDLVPGEAAGLFPVGRLDRDTEGLLLLTDDGELANALTHPSYHVPKTYEVTVKGVPDADDLSRLATGIELDEGTTAPAEVGEARAASGGAVVTLTIFEGKKRQVRRMFETIGHPVVRLERVAFGPLTTEELARGEYRALTEDEVREFRR